MEAFASSIQKVTIYGDEAVLELMAMGSAMGKLSGKNLQNATTAAIGLAKAYKMELVAAMRLVSRAAAGDTAQLKRYGIMINQSLSAQDKFNEVVKIGVHNFKLATDEAGTYQYAIAQMKNAIGDVRETIGEALTPTIIESAVAIKEWAKNSQASIGKWAKTSIAYIGFVKDILFGLAEFVWSDWKEAFKVGGDVVIKTFATIGKSIVAVTKGMAIAIGKTFTEYIKKEIIKLVPFLGGYMDIINNMLRGPQMGGGGTKFAGMGGGGRLGVRMRGGMGGGGFMPRVMLGKKSEKDIAAEMKVAWDATTAEMKVLWTDYAKDISDIIPKDLKDKLAKDKEKLVARLAAIAAESSGGKNVPFDLPGVPGMGGAGSGTPFSRRSNQPKEARFLTMRVGSAINPVERNTDKIAKSNEKISKGMGVLVRHLKQIMTNAAEPTLAEADLGA